MSVGTTPLHLGSQGACGARSHFAAKKVALAAAFAALSLTPAASWSLGLGRLNVQSALGEPLRAEIDVTSITPEEAASLQSKMASPETYRAAGVDYNQVLGATSVALQKRPDGRSVLRLSSDRAVTEPFVDAILDLSWSSGRLVREYTLLFDPPAPKSAQTPALTSPAMDTPAPVPRAVVAAPSPAPVAQAPSAPAPAPVSKPKAAPVPAPVASKPAAPVPAPAPVKAAPAPAPVVAASASAPVASGQTVKVRSGDSLSQIAERTIKPGVSLDQMVVGLYRANPEAFQGNNMNRLKAGVVLQVPSAEKAQAVTPQEARQVIVAQSSDFSAYRQRLATGVAESVKPAQERQAKGKVEAEVQDRKQAAAPSPDKLTLSKGGMASSQPGVEDKLSKARAQQETGTRVTELSRNLDELRKLKEQAASKAAAAKAPAPTAPAPVAKAPAVPVPAPAPAPVAKPAPAPAVVASAPAPAPKPEVKASAPVAAPAPTPAVVPASAPAPAAVPASVAAPASTPEFAASGAATTVANAASAASAAEPAPMVPTIPRPVQIPMDSAPVEQPGFFQTVDPLMLAGAGVLVAGLAGAGLFLRSRRRPDSAETSFLESRLQPDSFFGASGGQRVDTRDASGGPSSMSYSLSQLDAIGDVDPVAEADVYLAYGRDLQAEEILKEALRSNPDRLAIRTKLLEVYAKRRDTKGYEQLAVQLFGLTGGEGEDWARAQEMGLSIDPDNQLYQPGGQPAANVLPEAESYEPLGASTVPVSVMPAMAQAAMVAPEPEPMPEPDLDAGLDLDISAPAPLDFPDVPSVSEPAPQAVAQAQAPELADQGLDFDLPDLDAAAEPDEFPPVSFEAAAPTEPVSLSELASEAAAAPAPTPSGFDLGSISLDLDEPASAQEPLPVGEVGLPELDDAASDPMARKLDLAEEFRQIGDVDGARELLQEVIASAQDASLQSKARNMLDDLG